MIRILVVDDDKNIRLFLKSLLESEDYQVLLASCDQNALDILDKHSIDA